MAERILYYRLEATKQTPEVADLQEQSGEMWGGPPLGSYTPKVQAYRGSLPPGRRGIEFETDVVPDWPYGPVAEWSGPRDGVRVENDFAKIFVRITRRTQ